MIPSEITYYNLLEPTIEEKYSLTKIAKSDNYREILIKHINKTGLNLPTRLSTIKFFKSLTDSEIGLNIIKCYTNLNNHSQDVVQFVSKKDGYWENRLDSSNSKENQKCGHPYYSQCYIDSNKCMMCDAIKVLEIDA
jgi:hypothetical protein